MDPDWKEIVYDPGVRSFFLSCLGGYALIGPVSLVGVVAAMRAHGAGRPRQIFLALVAIELLGLALFMGRGAHPLAALEVFGIFIALPTLVALGIIWLCGRLVEQCLSRSGPEATRLPRRAVLGRLPFFFVGGLLLFVIYFWRFPPSPASFYSNGGDDLEPIAYWFIVWISAPVAAGMIAAGERRLRRRS